MGSSATIQLIQGVLYRAAGEDTWRTGERVAASVRDHVATTGVDVVLDEDEGKRLGRAGGAVGGTAAPPPRPIVGPMDTHRTLGTPGHTGLQTSPLGLGCMGMSQSFGPRPPREEMIDFLRQAVERGVTLFDTAEVYGPFHNEELVGEALGPVRDQVVIATKFGFDLGEDGSQHGVTSRPERIRAAVDGSLRRLRTDTIDLLYQHRVDPDVPIEEVAGTVKELIEAGKVRHFGLSEAGVGDDPARARRPAGHGAAERVLPVLARARGARSCRRSRSSASASCRSARSGAGFLTGRVTADTEFGEGDIRATLPRFEREALEANLALVDHVRQVADRKGATVGQVALAWLLAQQPWIVPIPGTRRLERLDENLDSASLDLTADDLAELDRASASVALVGERYPEAMARMIDR